MLEGWEAGKLKDGRWDVVMMRWWAVLERESLKAEGRRTKGARPGVSGAT